MTLLDALKSLLGIDAADTTEDANLTRLIDAAFAWVEGETRRYFGAPVLTTEYMRGTGRRELYLPGHIDDSSAADDVDPAKDPTTSLHIFRRPVWEPTRDWEELIEGEDWERRRDTVVFLRMWMVWPCEDELKLTFLNGYVTLPEDLRELIIELASNQYLLNSATTSGLAGVTSEKLGDFSYTVDLGATAGLANTTLSSRGYATLQHYKRMLV